MTQQQLRAPKRPPDEYPPGFVGVLSDEFSRASMFTFCLANLVQPLGTKMAWKNGVDPVSGLNTIIRGTLASDAEWLWVIGDDHSFMPDILFRLLDCEVPIVAPVCLKRQPPYHPVHYGHVEGPDYYVLRLGAYTPDDGAVEVVATGGAGLLIRREVLEAIDDPWFERTDRHRLNEDLAFCAKARDAGFPIHVDISTTIGHIMTAAVWPEYTEEHGWRTEVKPNSGFSAVDPAADDAIARADHQEEEYGNVRS